MVMIPMILTIALSQTIPSQKPNLIRTESFQMGQTTVSYCHQITSPDGVTLLKPNSTEVKPVAVQSNTPISLTPTGCSQYKCDMPVLFPPQMSNCQTVVQTLLNNSTGSFIAPLNTWVVVSAGDCAVTFQNNVMEHNHYVQSTWAKLGLESEKILAHCLIPNPASHGGQCMFGSYLDYNLDNLGLVVSGWSDERDIAKSL
ncbi:uncharacterized protein PGTG_04999 [Puccinia graminis f. sp. tritici CRL 75-36-700-3]|uniref:Ecp2 effector protein domain-containing protein n=1 Tax=Puccinia graminis f. sp. tritici (strain CRL 75-36-700-3 / race SCCL) TaxID=418459 RepID=E3K3I6_PUCGT|nr:uncharacterized protein PGTG_04999 [Puccinia graminis f. sp. tritici CRL 75-36-700-3]EFP79043.2 hypothetical protein PGTG_04999 [Puccinia graminis f. sp. tritici CRL 75-36-700-3]